MRFEKQLCPLKNRILIQLVTEGLQWGDDEQLPCKKNELETGWVRQIEITQSRVESNEDLNPSVCGLCFLTLSCLLLEMPCAKHQGIFSDVSGGGGGDGGKGTLMLEITCGVGSCEFQLGG